MNILCRLILIAICVLLASCGSLHTYRPDGSVTGVDPGIGKPISLGATEPGPVVCEQVDQACVDENKRRVEALNQCYREANQCKLGCALQCGPEPDGNTYPDKHRQWRTCTDHQTSCSLACDRLCDRLAKAQPCPSIPIAATCSRCANQPVARVKTCTWPAWPPIHPPGSPVVVPCDQDWSWAGTGACSACRAQAVNELQLGRQTCQCQYPNSQPAGQPWQRTCRYAPDGVRATP